ncbi:hypothetical protein ACSSNL_13370 [Thalassobius sp. S69A]
MIEGEQKTRLEQIRASGDTPDLPDLLLAEHLCEAMFKLGPTRSLGFGAEPTGWSEIAPFAQATGRVRNSWEAETLFEMCRSFHEENQAGKSPFRISPMEREG